MATVAIALALVSSVIYDFLKYGLTRTAERDYFEKALKESFIKVRDQCARAEPSVWAELTFEKSKRLQDGMIKCLQSPDIDEDKFLGFLEKELEKKGLSRKEAEGFYSKIFEEFKTIVNKGAIKNPKVFMPMVLNECKKHGVRFEEIADVLRAEGLALDAIKTQLDVIEKKIDDIAQERRAIVPTIQSVLRRNDPNISEGTFFRKEPAWIDFENGFIVERKEVDEIIKRLETCNVHLVSGGPSSGKSLMLKNVGFKLAKENKNVYIIELKKISKHKAMSYFNESLKMKDEPVFFIVDDAHLQLAACEEFVREFRNAGEAKAKLLVGSRKTEEIFDRSPKLASIFEHTGNTELSAGDMAKEIIRVYLRRKFRFSQQRAVMYSNLTFEKYEKDLWILSWALMAYDPKKGLIEDERIYEKIRDSIRNMGRDAEDALFPMSVLYRFEIPMERSFLEEHLSIEERVLEQLIGLSEIVQFEETGMGRTLILIHSSIAELYFEAYKAYPDLGKKVKSLLRNDDTEYGLLELYLTKSDPTNSLDILCQLRADWSNKKKGQTLLARLLGKEEVKISVREGIAKETDLDRISTFIRVLSWGVVGIYIRSFDIVRSLFPSFTKRDLMRMYFEDSINLYRNPMCIAEREAAAFYGFSGDVARTKKNLGLILAKYVDFDKLLAKIQREQDMTKVIECISNITRVDEKRGLDLARKIDFSKMKKEDFIEFAECCLRSGSFELFPEILRHFSPEKKKQLKNFLRYLGILARPHFAQLRNWKAQ